MRALLVFIVMLGCGGKEDAGSAGGSGASGSAKGSAAPAKGSAAPSAGSAGSGAVAVKPVVKGKLEYDTAEDGTGMSAAFSGRVPVLPAINSDATLIADFGSNAGMPQFPSPFFVEISPLGDKGASETLQVIDDEMANKEGEHGGNDWKPTGAVAKTIRERVAAVEKRLRDGGFVSLHKIDVEDDGTYGAKPTKIGGVTLAAKRNDDDILLVTLTDATGKSLHKESIKSFESKEAPAPLAGSHCNYSPFFSAAYTDAAKRMLYVYVRFRFHEECTQQPIKVLSWALPEPPPPSPDEAAIATLLSEQIAPNGIPEVETKFTADAQLIAGATMSTRDQAPWIIKTSSQLYSGHDDANVQVVLARDGKTAWASLTTTIGLDEKNDPHGQDAAWRVSSVMTKTPAGWRIVASTWTEAITDAVSEKDAKAGKRKAGTFAGDGGDKSVREAFAKLVSAGVDADAAKRPDLVLIGTAPGERTVGGAQFAKVWNGAFKGKVAVVSSSAKLAPSNTTGWVAATLELPQKGYKLPFHAFCVFDKTAAGTWSLVHAHFSIY